MTTEPETNNIVISDGRGGRVSVSVNEVPITELNLSVRARKCTTALGISTIGGLIRHTAKDLMARKNFGVTSLKEVREKLAEYNLKLKGE